MTETSPDRSPSAIEHSLTLDILRGRYAAGSRLPTVRELAEQHGVNPTTIQRAVSRLETRGLVTARQGSGLRVNDPAECGDISLVPQWLEVTLDQPTRAAGILADLLEMRRALAGRLLLRHRVAILARLPALQQAAQRVRRAQGDPDAVRDADLAFSRELLRAAGNVVALSVFNTVARVLVELPLVSAAMYAAPEENVASMAQVLGALAGGGEDAGAVIEGAIAAIDARTVARFEASLQARRGEAGPAAAQGLSVGVRA